jgi:hypothetical protein
MSPSPGRVDVSDSRIVCQRRSWNGVIGGVIFGLGGLVAAPVGNCAGLPLLGVVFLLVVATFGIALLFLSPYAYVETLDKTQQRLTLEKRHVLGRSIREVPFADITAVAVESARQFDNPIDAYVVFVSLSTGEKIAVGDRDCTEKDEQEDLAQMLRSFLGGEK